METIQPLRAALCATAVLACILVCGASVAPAATLEQKWDAIERGLQYLAHNQQINGRWIYSGNPSDDCAATGAALVAFQKAGYTAGTDVVIGGTHYGDVVGLGLDYMLSMAQQIPISVRPYGDPDTNGNGYGVRFGTNGRDVMITGNVLRGLVAANTPDAVVTVGPLAGQVYRDVAQDAVDYFAYAQVAVGNYFDGGWRYSCNYTNSDQSCSPWPAHGMLAAEQWGVWVPGWVREEFQQYVGYIQNPSDGGAFYMPLGVGGMGSNVYRTGELLTQQSFLGEEPGMGSAENALTFINSRWQTTASGWDGNFGNPGAMWAAFQGLEKMVGLDDTSYITNLRPFNPGSMDLDPGAVWNWSEDYCEWLVDYQLGDGHWNPYGVWYGTMPTSFATEMLLVAVPEPATLALLGLGGLALVRKRRPRA